MSALFTSEASKSNKFNDLLDTNTELLHDGDTSDSPSENDSFTCSEYEYETPFNGAKPATETPSGGMVFRYFSDILGDHVN